MIRMNGIEMCIQRLSSGFEQTIRLARPNHVYAASSELARLAANVVEPEDAHVSLASVPARRVMHLSGR